VNRLPVAKETYLSAATHIVREVRSASPTHLLELLRLRTGDKRVLRLVVDDDEYAKVSGYGARAGLSVVRASIRLKEKTVASTGDTYMTAVDWENPEGRLFPVFLGNKEDAAACAAAESEHMPSEQIGLLLGIPRCCAANYSFIQAGEAWLSLWLAGVTGEELFDAHANHLASYMSGCGFAGEYLPCHITCGKTIRLAHKGKQAALWFGLNDLVDEVVAYARRPVLVIGDDLIFLPQGMTAAAAAYASFHMLPEGLLFHGPNAAEWAAALSRASRASISADEVVFSCAAGECRRGRVHVLAGQRPLFLRFEGEG
jgi:hypothetical protein